MLKYSILAAALVTLSGCLTLTVHPKQRFIKEIKEGPYQNYSGQPLVDLGGKFYYFEINVAVMGNPYIDVVTQKPIYLVRSVFVLPQFGTFLIVSIEDEVENQLILDHILTNIGPRNFWTSGSDSAQEGQFVWTSTGRPVSYTYWHSGEPNNDGGIEDTINIWYQYGVLKWNDFPSTIGCYAICEEI